MRGKGMEAVKEHAGRFVQERLSVAYPKNDGKQTPMKGHPVFIAAHATGTCCRDCLMKWHGIEKGRELSGEEKAHIVSVLMEWIRREMK